MTPIDQARRVYRLEPCARTFDQDLSWHLDHGFVFSTPEFFVMGRPVNSGAKPEIIVGLNRFPATVCDAWHVYLMAGDMSKAWGILPWELPLVTIERRNVLKVYRLDSIRRLSGARPKTP
jgi:hypothetical protein